MNNDKAIDALGHIAGCATLGQIAASAKDPHEELRVRFVEISEACKRVLDQKTESPSPPPVADLAALERAKMWIDARIEGAPSRGFSDEVPMYETIRTLINNAIAAWTENQLAEIRKRNSQIVAAYEAGSTLKQCSEIFGVSVGSVRHALKMFKVTPRERSYRS